jgi:disulfide bond formation protein DsbB
MTRQQTTLVSIVALQSFAALLGSLFFSNGLGYAPCDLCWYQRIAMYPLGVLAIVALFRRDVQMVWYALPLSIIGLMVAVFHTTLYVLANYTANPVTIQCSVNGTSCTSKYVEYFGFLSIPVLSLIAFIVTTGALLMLAASTRKATK